MLGDQGRLRIVDSSVTSALHSKIKLVLSEVRPGGAPYIWRGKKLLGPADPPTASDPPYIANDPNEVELFKSR